MNPAPGRPHEADTAPNWSVKTRGRFLQQAVRQEFDLIIIGGGITGAGLAREAALRGLSFCLLERTDFAAGTSSRSSKLAHGGMRYLAQGDFALVRSATTERNWLIRHFPNLVTPEAFIVNAYNGTKDTPGSIRAGLSLYRLLSDTFTRFKNHARHTFIRPDRIAEFEPKIRTDGLRFSGLYYDAGVNDARLTLETVREALQISAYRSVALNYVKVTDLTYNGGMVTGVTARNVLSGQPLTVRGAVTVNATGVWADEILALHGVEDKAIRPTKGVHVVVPASRVGNRHSIGLRSADDGRFYFILKRGEWDIIGTTDTDYAEDLDDPFCTAKDCGYLLRSVNILFPGANLQPRDVISTYAGIRPLRRRQKKRNAAESSASRRHFILDNDDRLITVAGGKLTEFRRMAEDVILRLSRKGLLPRFRGAAARRGFSRVPFRSGITTEQFNRIVLDEKLAEFATYEQLRHFHRQYGRAAISILKRIRQKPESGKPLLAGYPYCRAEIEHILENECVVTLSDVMLRRTEMQIFVPYARQKELAERTAGILGSYLGWNEGKTRQETNAYLNSIRHTAFFLNRPPRRPAGRTAGHGNGPGETATVRESFPSRGRYPARKD